MTRVAGCIGQTTKITPTASCRFWVLHRKVAAQYPSAFLQQPALRQAMMRAGTGNGRNWRIPARAAATSHFSRAIPILRRATGCGHQTIIRTAELFLDIGDRRRGYILEQMQICSHLYLSYLVPKGEIIQIPGSDDSLMHGYFLRAPGSAPQTPVVICIGGPDHLKEEHLYKMPRHAHARKLSLLVVDLPGQGVCPRRDNMVGPHDVETSISCWIDYPRKSWRR